MRVKSAEDIECAFLADLDCGGCCAILQLCSCNDGILCGGPVSAQSLQRGRNLRGPWRCGHRSARRLCGLRRCEANLHHQRQRREYVVRSRRFPIRMEENFRRRHVDRRHFFPHQHRQRAQESGADAAAEPRCRFGLCRRRAARQRVDLAAIPRRERRGDPRDSVEPLGSEAPAHRQARRLRLHVAGSEG